MSKMKSKKLSKGVYHLSHEETEPGEYFKKTTIFSKDSIGLEKHIYLWFKPGNSYPETIINEINKGITLQSIINETVSYRTGNGFTTENKELNTYLNNTRLNLENEKFLQIFGKTNKSFTKSGNAFIKITTDDNGTFMNLEVVPFHKCRLGNGDNKGSILINPNWAKRDIKDDVILPLYPKFKKRKINGSVSKIQVKESIYHIKDIADGLDHYGINELMRASLKLNEKEYRRINWQTSQIKKGFKRDFLFVTEYPIRDKVKEANDKAFERISGDDKAGGVETVSADGDDGKLIPVQDKYEFDFIKDDTEHKLFILWAFPKSLMGIRSKTGIFSVEQIESDYEQYMIDVVKKQEFMLDKFNVLFENILGLEAKELNVENTPPAIILQNYMTYMNDSQKNAVIENVFKKYGIEETNVEPNTE